MPEPIQPPASQPEQHQQNDAPLTMEGVRQLLAERDAQWERKIEAINNNVMAQKRGPGRPRKEEAEPPTTEAVEMIQQFKREQADATIRSSLNSNLEAIGVIDVAKVGKFFASNYGDRISVDADGVAVFRESETKTLPLKEYIHAWSQSAEGQMFTPARPGPQGVGFAPRTSAPVASANAFRSMDFAQIMERRKIDRSAVNAYAEAYPDEFRRKKAEFERKSVMGIK